MLTLLPFRQSWHNFNIKRSFRMCRYQKQKFNLSLYRPLGPPLGPSRDRPSLKIRISGTMRNWAKYASNTFVEDKKCNKNMSYHLSIWSWSWRWKLQLKLENMSHFLEKKPVFFLSSTPKCMLKVSRFFVIFFPSTPRHVQWTLEKVHHQCTWLSVADFLKTGVVSS